MDLDALTPRLRLPSVRAVTVVVTTVMAGGCAIYVPPLSNTDLKAAVNLKPGVSTATDVRKAFGAPDALDTPEFKMYHAHHDYGFAAFGVAVGCGIGGSHAEIIKRRDMVVVARFDARQTLTRLEGWVWGQGIPAPTTGNYVPIFSGEKKSLFGTDKLSFEKVVASRDGRTIVARDQNSSLWLRDAQTMSEVIDPTPFVGKLADFTISQDGSMLGLVGNGAVVMDVKSRQPTFLVEGQGAEKSPFSSVKLTEHDAILIATLAIGISRWRLSTGEQLPVLQLPKGASPHSLVASPDGQRFAAIVDQKSTVVWKASTGEIVARLPARRDAPAGIAFLNSQGSEIAVSYSGDGSKTDGRLEVFRLQQSGDGQAKLTDVLPVGGHLVSDPERGYVVVGTQLLDLSGRGARGDQSSTSYVCGSTFAGTSTDRLIVSTSVGVFYVPTYSTHDLTLNQALLDRW